MREPHGGVEQRSMGGSSSKVSQDSSHRGNQEAQTDRTPASAKKDPQPTRALRLASDKLVSDSNLKTEPETGNSSEDSEDSDYSLSGADEETVAKVATPDKRRPSRTTDHGPATSDSETSEEEPLAQRVRTQWIDWRVVTQSKIFSGIVSKREEILAEQRRFAESPLQAKSEFLVKKELRYLAAQGTLYCQTQHNAFINFAKKARMPPYPVSVPLIALFIGHTSMRSTPRAARAWLNKVHGRLQDIWKDDPVYQRLERWPDAEEGIREFMREQTCRRIGRPRKVAIEDSTAHVRPIRIEPAKKSRHNKEEHQHQRYKAERTEKTREKRRREEAKARHEAPSTATAEKPRGEFRQPHREHVHPSLSTPAQPLARFDCTPGPATVSGTGATATPRYTSPPSVLDVPDPVSFLPTLTAFLLGLHPSLGSLAPALYSSGIDSFDSLSCLVSYERSTLDRFLIELQKLHRVSIVHVKLFVKSLHASRDGAFQA